MDNLKKYLIILLSYPVISNAIWYFMNLMSFAPGKSIAGALFELIWLPAILIIYGLPIILYFILSRRSKGLCVPKIYNLHLILLAVCFLSLLIASAYLGTVLSVASDVPFLGMLPTGIRDGLTYASVILLINAIRGKKRKFIRTDNKIINQLSDCVITLFHYAAFLFGATNVCGLPPTR